MKSSALFQYDFSKKHMIASLSKIEKFDFEDGPTGLGGINLLTPDFPNPYTWIVTDVLYIKNEVVSWTLTISPLVDKVVYDQFSEWSILIYNY